MLPLIACGPAPAQPVPTATMHAPGERPDPGRDPELDRLANQPGRPEWAPLPLLRGGPAPLSALRRLLRAADMDDRARSCFLLGQIGDALAVPALRTALTDPARTVRIHAGIALASMCEGDGTPACEAALQSEPPWLRFLAVHALWSLNTDRARAALARHRSDQDPLVAEALAAALKSPPTISLKPVPADEVPADDLTATDIWERAADALTTEADWWWHRGDYDQAIRCHETAIFLDPTFAEDYAVAAWLQWSLGRDEAAVRTLKRGIAAMPSNPDAHFNLGYHYLNTHREALAREPLRRAVELGGDVLCRRAYAHSLEHIGELQPALQQWDEMLRIDPGDDVARANRLRVQQLAAGATP
jgi:tetratricopeptide (TPR) repeat protein